MTVQWAQLGGEIVIASDHGAGIQPFGMGTAAFAAPMPDSAPSTVASTRNLLDGAIAAAERRATTGEHPPMTALRWAWQLLNQWYSAYHSIALMPEAIDRFEREGREDLAAFSRQKLREEQGHEQMPLADLRALGYDADALVHSIAPDPAIAEGVQYAHDTVRGPRPASFLGYVYAIERRVIRIPEDWLASVERLLPRGVNGTSGLRAHATSLDLEHVGAAVEFFASLPAGDRTAIAVGCHRIAELRCAWLTGSQPREEQLAKRLQRFAAEPVGSSIGQQGEAA
jgi:hypothetical protein